jgi:plasmid stabilization system protein ParE
MKVVWTDRAKDRLRKIREYIAQDAPRVAARVVRELLVRSRQLERTAYSAVVFPNTRAAMCASCWSGPIASFTWSCRIGST